MNSKKSWKFRKSLWPCESGHVKKSAVKLKNPYGWSVTIRSPYASVMWFIFNIWVLFIGVILLHSPNSIWLEICMKTKWNQCILAGCWVEYSSCFHSWMEFHIKRVSQKLLWVPVLFTASILFSYLVHRYQCIQWFLSKDLQ